MKKIVAFNTSYGTRNLGDFIITESIEREFENMYSDAYVINFPTHTPICHAYQYSTKLGLWKFMNDVNLKFIYGTNIIKKNMFTPINDWNVNIFNCKPYCGSILVGAGMGGSFKKVNLYTKFLYKKILSKDMIHSTRDEKTKKFIESLGLKAINTGCATMWMLTKEHCKKIPKSKSKNVVFTLTDYSKDCEKDQQMINILTSNYDNVFFWVQGIGDADYLNELENTDNIQLIYSLKNYRELLKYGGMDYVGTRLHAGIFAMQNCIRSIIITVDNRARDMKDSYNLICIERDNISELDNLINSEFETLININEKNINTWKSQFSKYGM